MPLIKAPPTKYPLEFDSRIISLKYHSNDCIRVCKYISMIDIVNSTSNESVIKEKVPKVPLKEQFLEKSFWKITIKMPSF